MIAYHGARTGGFRRFSKRFLGTGVVGSNGSGGFYFSSDPDAAAFFADPIEVYKESDEPEEGFVYGEDEFYILLGEINTGPYETEEIAQQQLDRFREKWREVEMGDVVFEDDRVMRVRLRIDNPLVVEDMSEFRKVEKTAEADGFDAVIGMDVVDGDRPSDVYLVFDPDRIEVLDV